MASTKVQQMEFPGVLFDVLFGFIMFLSIDSFLGIDSPLHFVFYLFSLIILIHWWLIFKSAGDISSEAFRVPGLPIIIRITELIIIEHAVLAAGSFDFILMVWFIVSLIFINLLWAVARRYAGECIGTNERKIKGSKKDLDGILVVNSVVLMLFSFLALFSQFAQVSTSAVIFIVFYCFFIALTFRYKIIDLKKS
jgi:hypothetical protein